MRKEKIRETDYSETERPLTRREQLLDVLKHRFLEIIKLSLLQTVFNMPLFVSVILFWMALRNASNINQIMTIFLVQGGLFLIALPSSYVGLTGTFYCLKKILFAEGEYASSSFFVGLREEWKKGLFIGLITGLSATIGIIGFFFSYFYLTNINTTIAGLGIAIMVIQFIVVSILSYYSIAQVVMYENELKYILKNSFIFTLMRFPINLLFVIIHPGIVIALIAIMEITMFVGVGLEVFFVVFGHLLWSLNALFTFDKYINKENHPDYYRKGLRNINEEA